MDACVQTVILHVLAQFPQVLRIGNSKGIFAPPRRPRRTPGAGVLPRAPPQPAGVACSPATRGGARSGQVPLLKG